MCVERHINDRSHHTAPLARAAFVDPRAARSSRVVGQLRRASVGRDFVSHYCTFVLMFSGADDGTSDKIRSSVPSIFRP